MLSITVSSLISLLQRKFANLKHVFNVVKLSKREQVPFIVFERVIIEGAIVPCKLTGAKQHDTV